MPVNYTPDEIQTISDAISARFEKLPESIQNEVAALLGQPPDVRKITPEILDEIEVEIQDSIRRRIDKGLQKTVADLANEQRRELSAMIQAQPEAANAVPAAWWEAKQKKMEEAIFLFLVAAYGLSANWHGVDRTVAELEATDFARKRSRAVASSWIETTRKRLDKMNDKEKKIFGLGETGRVGGGATEGAGTNGSSAGGAVGGKPETPSPLQRLREGLESVFSPDRPETLSVTEVTVAISLAGETARRFQDADTENDLWFTRMDDRVCPVCEPLHRTSRAMWGNDYPNGPPAHPNCRCRIRYAQN